MATPVIQTEKTNLYLTTGKTQLHILKDVTFSLNPGEVAAVVGPSGSGKTSLLMVLGGLEKASSGKVVVGGRDITNLNEDQLAVFRRETLSIVFQSFHLIPSMTAIENVSLALEIAERKLSVKQIREAAAAALAEVGLGDRLHHLPNALSGGEQQRVGLARAMVTNPKLLLADEPTGNLDQDTGAKVIDMMFGVAREKGTAILLITHDRNLARQADRRLTMEHGRLTAEAEVVPA
ncbi:MAG TPA: ABC transporter ATP-binding protein [Devosiaceae bacterium]|jgi:putative ABC transport system ATP-binding protein|nr:ABC transporter ATP-binding protein [Devosiaceae bacterium]